MVASMSRCRKGCWCDKTEIVKNTCSSLPFFFLVTGLAAVQECLGAAHYPDISSDLAQVAELVLKDVQTPDFEFACSPCEAGIEILSLLQQAVFGSGSRDSSFMRCVQLSTSAEVSQLRIVDLFGEEYCWIGG